MEQLKCLANCVFQFRSSAILWNECHHWWYVFYASIFSIRVSTEIISRNSTVLSYLYVWCAAWCGNTLGQIPDIVIFVKIYSLKMQPCVLMWVFCQGTWYLAPQTYPQIQKCWLLCVYQARSSPSVQSSYFWVLHQNLGEDLLLGLWWWMCWVQVVKHLFIFKYPQRILWTVWPIICNFFSSKKSKITMPFYLFRFCTHRILLISTKHSACVFVTPHRMVHNLQANLCIWICQKGTLKKFPFGAYTSNSCTVSFAGKTIRVLSGAHNYALKVKWTFKFILLSSLHVCFHPW